MLLVFKSLKNPLFPCTTRYAFMQTFSPLFLGYRFFPQVSGTSCVSCCTYAIHHGSWKGNFLYLPFIAFSPAFMTSVAAVVAESTRPPGPPPFTNGELLAQPMIYKLPQRILTSLVTISDELSLAFLFIYFHNYLLPVEQLNSEHEKLYPESEGECKKIVNKIIKLQFCFFR